MIRYFYTLLLFLLSPVLLLTLYKKKPGKPRFGARWKEHFGFTPALENQSQRPIWIHTVSVGETIAATPFIRALKQKYPNTPIVITTTTSTGAEQAYRLTDIAEHRYMPIDLPFAVKGFIKKIRPQAMLIMETELWPNTLHYVAQSGCPITVINARLSERSAVRYNKFQSIFNLLSKNLNQVLCQHQDDAERFIRLGVGSDRVKITGSLKFDITVSKESLEFGAQLRSQLGKSRPIWIAASTHQGEDEQLLDAHKSLLKKHPEALLILVPRHPERFNDVYQLTISSGFITHRRTDESHRSFKDTQVYLADTMGEMIILLAASDVCFMGGSLIGDKVGGHNVLEPAALAKPIIIGPSYYNFSDMTNSLKNQKSLFIIEKPYEIYEKLDWMISNDIAYELGVNSKLFIEKNKGAIKRTVDLINEVI
ncbi:lipid IV(A) 3-deoxy-D-manno-octulosonic acid transferase [Vibrio algivorus]|uniref:3-deoxy-D-manno-octulosonic acid transferase n=1 Tax=Vibrio algivorus TaxID=1667024 RepID=A0ABQ6EK72_9VIBR|nr:lipid IV(A) 3-deoxy-D-manno-octulosonic acid transferase [Vibrio algivorus]GLT13156.1 3-deoxy-D-manno-octulosonic acid transferase [Vibrio algivorus]